MKNRNFLISIKHAMNGLKIAFKSEINFRTELYIGIIVLIFSYALKLNRYELILIIICITLVIGSELLNSSIEHLVDLASPEYHELAKKTKDIGAGAVLVISMTAAIIGLMIFVPKMIEFIK